MSHRHSGVRKNLTGNRNRRLHPPDEVSARPVQQVSFPSRSFEMTVGDSGIAHVRDNGVRLPQPRNFVEHLKRSDCGRIPSCIAAAHIVQRHKCTHSARHVVVETANVSFQRCKFGLPPNLGHRDRASQPMLLDSFQSPFAHHNPTATNSRNRVLVGIELRERTANPHGERFQMMSDSE